MRLRLASLAFATALLCSAALGGTGAVPALGSHDRVDEHVYLQPASGPGTNGEYARLDADGDLVLDLGAGNPGVDGEGVPGGSVTTVADVFTVTYNGSRNATVWLTDDTEAITFVVDGRAVESESAAVTLGPGESASVGLRVDARDGLPATTGTMTLHARLASDDAEDDPGGGGARLSRVGASESQPDAGDGSPAPAPTRISVSCLDSRVRVDVTGGRAGVPVDLSSGGCEGNVRLESVTLVPRRDDSFSLVAEASDRDDFETGGVPDATALGFVRFEHGWPDETVDEARVEVSVTDSWLESRGVDSGSVTLYRYTGDGWTALDTERVGRRGDRHVFGASAEGLTVFGVAGESATPAPDDGAASADAGAGDPAPDREAGPDEAGALSFLPIALVAGSLVIALLALRGYQRRA
jgi:hypothetical protein